MSTDAGSNQRDLTYGVTVMVHQRWKEGRNPANPVLLGRRVLSPKYSTRLLTTETELTGACMAIVVMGGESVTIKVKVFSVQCY